MLPWFDYYDGPRLTEMGRRQVGGGAGVCADEAPARRRRGNIVRHGPGLRVRVSAGKDPTTGERVVLSEVVLIAKPGHEASERAAAKKAEKVLTRLQAQADSLKVASTKATFGALLDRWGWGPAFVCSSDLTAASQDESRPCDRRFSCWLAPRR